MTSIDCYYTDHFVNQTVTQFFSKSLGLTLYKLNEYKNSSNIFATYGILRGTGEIIKQRKENFIYLDHGYFNSSTRRFTKEKNTILTNLEGYFRVVKDDLYFNKSKLNNNEKRFKELNIKLKEKKTGDIIILSEPTENTSKFLGLNNWKEETIKAIKSHTDREIVIHNKFSEITLNELLQKAYAFVSCQSTAGFMSIIEGVPAFFTHSSLKEYGDIKDIEQNKLNYDLLYCAANSQWKLKEFFSDDFKEYINKIISI